MRETSIADMRNQLAKAGISLPETELERLKPIYEMYMEKMKLMYTADLSEEVAGRFSPVVSTAPGRQP